MTVLSVALLSGVVGMLSPEGNTKKYVRLVGSLCILCALASPLVGLVVEGEDGLELLFPTVDGAEAYEDIYREAIAEGVRENAELAVKNMLISRFDIAQEELEIILSVVWQGEKYEVDGATVILKSSLVAIDPREITEYIKGELGCSCTVVYG